MKFDIRVSWEDIEEMVEDLAEAGVHEHTIAKVIGKFADDVVPFDALIPGPGHVLEAVDEHLFTAAASLGKVGKRAVEAVKDLLKRDPAEKTRRRAERRERREKRRQKRG
jgi:hypothetical protein